MTSTVLGRLFKGKDWEMRMMVKDSGRGDSLW